MKWTYVCPHCGAHLNPVESWIVLLAEHGGYKGMFLFNEEPGDYELVLPRDAKVNESEIWEFSCPVCNADLTAEGEPNIAMIKLFDEGGQEHAVFFSKIAGELATFIVNAQGVTHYGKDFHHYDDLLWMKFRW